MSENWDVWNENNRRVVAEFRANGGKAGGEQVSLPILVLTTIGAETVLSRESPLCFVTDAGGFVLGASKGGHPAHPHWYLNLLANPEVTIEVSFEKFAAVATFPEGPERRRLYDALIAAMPFFAHFEEVSTEREIPVVLLHRKCPKSE